MGQFAEQAHSDYQIFFIRPDNDLKAFTGTIFTFGEFKDWVEKLNQADF
jgi:hypothetical protein